MTTSNKQTDTDTKEQDFSIVFQKHRNPSQLEFLGVGSWTGMPFFLPSTMAARTAGGAPTSALSCSSELNKSDASSPAGSGYPGLQNVTCATSITRQFCRGSSGRRLVRICTPPHDKIGHSHRRNVPPSFSWWSGPKVCCCCCCW